MGVWMDIWINERMNGLIDEWIDEYMNRFQFLDFCTVDMFWILC